MELPLDSIAEAVGGEVRGDGDKRVSGVAGFDQATEDQITFAASKKYLNRIEENRAGAVIVPRGFESASKNLIQVDNPQIAFSTVVGIFYPPEKPAAGISPGAHIGEGLSHGSGISIAPFVSIGENVTLGDRVVVYPHVFIGNDVRIGDDVQIFPNVTVLSRCTIGNRVIINAGTVIGSDGFGFAPDGEKYQKIPQIGTVQIDDDVEIGALNAIDRATIGKTWIQKGVKTDNLVHVAHNVVVGENTILVAQVGISGSVTIGKHAILAGQAGIAGHIHIGNNVTIGGQAGVAKSVPDGEVLSGTVAMPHRQWLRVQRVMPMLPELSKRVADLEKKIKDIEKG